MSNQIFECDLALRVRPLIQRRENLAELDQRYELVEEIGRDDLTLPSSSNSSIAFSTEVLFAVLR